MHFFLLYQNIYDYVSSITHELEFKEFFLAYAISLILFLRINNRNKYMCK